jgi:hypothetical protein
MTCIVGIQHQGRVYIGGDSAGISGDSLTSRADAKVFTVGPYVMGFAHSFRMGQLLRYRLKAPKPPVRGLDRFMVTGFVDAVRTALFDGGTLTDRNGVQEGFTFLVGVGGRLYHIDTDFQIERTHDDYLAVGCGDDLALGSLFSTRGQQPRPRIRLALGAAAHHSSGVCAPFTVKVGRA